MEKLAYTLWRNPTEAADAWRERLLGPLAETLRRTGATAIQVNLVDDAVAAGQALRLISRDVPDGLLFFWLESAYFREACEAAISQGHRQVAGYVVTESCIKDARQDMAGARSPGFSLIGLLQRPPRLTEQEWLAIWLGSHTAVAVETQSTFRYVQNVVTRSLTEAAPVLNAIVEEGFPTAALTSPAAFYDAERDKPKFERNHARMMESCWRFIDFDRLDSLPTSEYHLAPR